MSNATIIFDVRACISALDKARVTDLARYVAHRMDEDPRLAELSFRDGWNTMLGGYANLITRDYSTPADA